MAIIVIKDRPDAQRQHCRTQEPSQHLRDFRAEWGRNHWMSIRCGRATVFSWLRLSPGVSNDDLLNEDLSLAINSFVMRPRLRDFVSRFDFVFWSEVAHGRERPERAGRILLAPYPQDGLGIMSPN
jgi:hypothetical protein